MADTTVTNTADNKGGSLISKTTSAITDIRRLLNEPAAKRALPTPNGRTLFHAIFQYSTFNTCKNRSTITGGANSKQKNGMHGKMSKRRSTTANASYTDPSRNWISDIPLSSQCVLQINADGFKIYATPGTSEFLSSNNILS